VDLATIVGLVLGIACVLAALVIGGSFISYVDPASLMIVLGGGTAATLTAFPLARFMKLPRISARALFHKTMDPAEMVDSIVGLAEVARRDGILALENSLNNIEDPFLISGIQMAVDGTDPDVIEQVMEADLENLIERHESGKGMLESLGRYAPAFGMIGTLIGLVAMLSGMDDPKAIGAGMAAALLTTLYGALIANVVFLPMADKLGVRTSEETLLKTMIIQGVMSIQSGDNPRNVESKLLTFLPPTSRITQQQRREAA
jgi:chemotaxis protein MotA